MKRATRKLIRRATQLQMDAAKISAFMDTEQFKTLPEFNQQQFRDRAIKIADEMKETAESIRRVEE